jgi:hypothetical protein
MGRIPLANGYVLGIRAILIAGLQRKHFFATAEIVPQEGFANSIRSFLKRADVRFCFCWQAERVRFVYIWSAEQAVLTANRLYSGR